MILFIGLWSHALAATLFGALAVWQLRHWNGDRRNRPLVAAFAVMSVWAIFVALLGPRHLFSGLAGGKQDACRHSHEEDKGKLRSAHPLAAGNLDRARRRHHQDEVEQDRNQ